MRCLTLLVYISIHAPRVGSDVILGEVTNGTKQFQSTLPVWGATAEDIFDYVPPQFQSTLPVWGATNFLT